MTEKQITEFADLIHKIHDAKDLYGDAEPLTFKKYKCKIEYDESTYITEDDKYFFGTVDYANYDIIVEFMKKYKLDTKYSVSD